MRWFQLILLGFIGLVLGACATTTDKASPRAKASATDSARLDSIYCLSVEGSEAQHYITGSVHFPLFFKLEAAPPILALVERSDVLLLEATLPPIREEVIESERLRRTLGELIPPISDKVVELIDERLGQDRRMTRQAWLRLNPVVINQALESQIGFPQPRGISLDAQLVRAARLGGNDINGIELMKEQVLIVNKVPTQQWENIFQDQITAIGDESRREYLLGSLRAQYRTIEGAQWDQFDAVMRSQDHYLSMLVLAVSDARNQTLADRIVERLQADQRSHFIALGAAHMGGEQGVLALLRARGVLLEKNCQAAGISS